MIYRSFSLWHTTYWTEFPPHYCILLPLPFSHQNSLLLNSHSSQNITSLPLHLIKFEFLLKVYPHLYISSRCYGISTAQKLSLQVWDHVPSFQTNSLQNCSYVKDCFTGEWVGVRETCFHNSSAVNTYIISKNTVFSTTSWYPVNHRNMKNRLK